MVGNIHVSYTHLTARRLHEIAQSQQGFFTTKQAIRSGFAGKTHSYHVKAGNWIREHRGIYRLADFPAPERPDLMLSLIHILTEPWILAVCGPRQTLTATRKRCRADGSFSTCRRSHWHWQRLRREWLCADMARSARAATPARQPALSLIHI